MEIMKKRVLKGARKTMPSAKKISVELDLINRGLENANEASSNIHLQRENTPNIQTGEFFLRPSASKNGVSVGSDRILNSSDIKILNDIISDKQTKRRTLLESAKEKIAKSTVSFPNFATFLEKRREFYRKRHFQNCNLENMVPHKVFLQPLSRFKYHTKTPESSKKYNSVGFRENTETSRVSNDKEECMLNYRKLYSYGDKENNSAIPHQKDIYQKHEYSRIKQVNPLPLKKTIFTEENQPPYNVHRNEPCNVDPRKKNEVKEADKGNTETGSHLPQIFVSQKGIIANDSGAVRSNAPCTLSLDESRLKYLVRSSNINGPHPHFVQCTQSNNVPSSSNLYKSKLKYLSDSSNINGPRPLSVQCTQSNRACFTPNLKESRLKYSARLSINGLQPYSMQCAQSSNAPSICLNESKLKYSARSLNINGLQPHSELHAQSSNAPSVSDSDEFRLKYSARSSNINRPPPHPMQCAQSSNAPSSSNLDELSLKYPPRTSNINRSQPHSVQCDQSSNAPSTSNLNKFAQQIPARSSNVNEPQTNSVFYQVSPVRNVPELSKNRLQQSILCNNIGSRTATRKYRLILPTETMIKHGATIKGNGTRTTESSGSQGSEDTHHKVLDNHNVAFPVQNDIQKQMRPHQLHSQSYPLRAIKCTGQNSTKPLILTIPNESKETRETESLNKKISEQDKAVKLQETEIASTETPKRTENNTGALKIEATTITLAKISQVLRRFRETLSDDSHCVPGLELSLPIWISELDACMVSVEKVKWAISEQQRKC